MILADFSTDVGFFSFDISTNMRILASKWHILKIPSPHTTALMQEDVPTLPRFIAHALARCCGRSIKMKQEIILRCDEIGKSFDGTYWEVVFLQGANKIILASGLSRIKSSILAEAHDRLEKALSHLNEMMKAQA